MIAMRRFTICIGLAAIVIVCFGAVPAGAQTVRCQLTNWRGWGYGLHGRGELTDQADSSSALTRTDRRRYWPPSPAKVSIYIAAGPKSEPPWRGNFQFPDYGDSFEIVRQHMTSDKVRLIQVHLRSGRVGLPLELR
jgi:hypothetical protein